MRIEVLSLSISNPLHKLVATSYHLAAPLCSSRAIARSKASPSPQPFVSATRVNVSIVSGFSLRFSWAVRPVRRRRCCRGVAGACSILAGSRLRKPVASAACLVTSGAGFLSRGFGLAQADGSMSSSSSPKPREARSLPAITLQSSHSPPSASRPPPLRTRERSGWPFRGCSSASRLGPTVFRRNRTSP